MGWKITSILWDTLWARTEKCIHFHKRFQFINNEANVFGPQKEAGGCVSMWSFLTTHRYLLEYTPPACAEIISSIFSCKIGVKAGCVTSSSPRLHKMGTIHHLSRDAPQEKPMFTCIFIGLKQSNALAHFFHLTFYSKQYVRMTIKIRSGVLVETSHV